MKKAKTKIAPPTCPSVMGVYELADKLPKDSRLMSMALAILEYIQYDPRQSN